MTAYTLCHLARSRTVRVVSRALVLFAVFVYGVGVGGLRWPPYSTLNAVKEVLCARWAGRQYRHRSIEEAYTLGTHRHSYFALDSRGDLVLKNAIPYRSEGVYQFKRTIYPDKTAVVVMDPWVDMASTHLNNYFGLIIESRLVPLVKRALVRGHPVIILTNDPYRDYNARIHSELQLLVDSGKANALFHQDYDDGAFAAYLRARGIEALIYTGFASNMCLLGRQMGMISLAHHGFQMYFVPDASAAVEHGDAWDDQSIHKAATIIISQWIAEIIHYEEFMSVPVL